MTVHDFIGPPAPIVISPPTPTKPALVKPSVSPSRSRRDDRINTTLGRIEFDRYVVTYFANKLTSCKDRGIAFNLTFVQVKNMLRAKKCQYTGIELTHTVGQRQRPTDVTIERINSDLPYETGNVCAVSHAANQAKAGFDAQFGKEASSMIHMISKNLKKRSK